MNEGVTSAVRLQHFRVQKMLRDLFYIHSVYIKCFRFIHIIFMQKIVTS
jgi:hypothetical protein